MYFIIKRFVDIVVSFIVIIILLPFFMCIAVLLKFSAEGEVLYFQKRVGFKGTRFYVWKFATMIKNSINMGTGSITLEDDFRVTKYGKILRKTKINELPQIINVLKGDISLVGPRPLVEDTFMAYPKKVQEEILKIKPGITGIGSIVFRDEEKIISSIQERDPFEFYKNVIAPYKGALELWYKKNRSLIVDFKIIILTIWIVIFPASNVYERWFKDLPKRKT